MLVKILSQKSFLLQFFIGSLFLALFFSAFYPVNTDLHSILSILVLLGTAALGSLFYIYSDLVKIPGTGLWFYLIWVIVFSGIASDFSMTVSLLLNTLIFMRWIGADNPGEGRKILFENGFLLAVSGLFYPPSLFLFVFLIIGYFYTQAISLKGILMLIIGLTLPVLIGIQLLYLTDNIAYIENFEGLLHPEYWDSPVWMLLPLGLLLLFSWTDHLLNFGAQDIHKRLKYFLVFVYFINWTAILILFSGNKTYSLMFLGLPVSVFLSRFVCYSKSGSKKEIWLWLYAVIMAVYYFRNELAVIYNNLFGNISFQL